MRKKILPVISLIAFMSLLNLSCQKETIKKTNEPEELTVADCSNNNYSNPPYNLNVTLYGTGNKKGNIKFTQDPDPAKIIVLKTKVEHLQPNHEYLLQRAVDPINEVDGNCTSTTWLTLGYGLDPKSIITNIHGKGEEELWRDLSSIASGSKFDIHFQIVDAASNAVVLTSGCYQYTVR
jgi:hypothetical protein